MTRPGTPLYSGVVPPARNAQPDQRCGSSSGPREKKNWTRGTSSPITQSPASGRERHLHHPATPASVSLVLSTPLTGSPGSPPCRLPPSLSSPQHQSSSSSSFRKFTSLPVSPSLLAPLTDRSDPPRALPRHLLLPPSPPCTTTSLACLAHPCTAAFPLHPGIHSSTTS